jgi:F-type H+-transporting ATPase subunit epsilon
MEQGDRGIGGAGDRLMVSLVSPEAVLLEEAAATVQVPAWDGLVGIFPRHAPLLALLGRGVLTVTAAGGRRRFRVAGGFVQVREDSVRVVAEEASPLDGQAAV